MMSDFVEPRTETETTLVEMWRHALRVDAVGVDDDFFELGGDSLRATQIVVDVQQRFNVDLPLESIFNETSTIARMAGEIDRLLGGQDEPGTRFSLDSRPEEPPASFAQQAFWALSRVFRDEPFFNLGAAVRFRGALDIFALEKAISNLIQRHEALRTIFAQKQGHLVQCIVQPEPITLVPIRIDATSGEDPEAIVSEQAKNEVQQAFDLAAGPLVRFVLLQLESEDHVLVIARHHAVSDAWSRGILIRELIDFYRVAVGDVESRIAELPAQFADFSLWQTKLWDAGRFEDDFGYWQQKLDNPPPKITLPADRERSGIPDWEGRRVTFALTPDLASLVRQTARHHRTTVFVVLLSGFYALLKEATGQNDMAVGVQVANRMASEFRDVIGCFISQLPFRIDVESDLSMSGLLAQIDQTAKEAYSHQELPLEKLVPLLKSANSPMFDFPTFPVWFQLLTYEDIGEVRIGEMIVQPFDFDQEIAPVELEVNWRDQGEGLECTFNYDTALFDSGRIDAMALRYQAILARMLGDLNLRLSQLLAT